MKKIALFCSILLMSTLILSGAAVHHEDGTKVELCAICLKPLANSEDLIFTKKCPKSHFFHFNCLDKWDRTKNHADNYFTPCPMCNTPFTPVDVVALPAYYGFTQLHVAVYNNDEATVCACINNKDDINATALGGITPLLIAADKGNFELVNLLFEHGANPNITMKGLTVLDWALVHNYDKNMYDFLQTNNALHSRFFTSHSPDVCKLPIDEIFKKLLKTS
ncbi:MAG: ankyrin repeat domain-containing protein [Candidatus Babeliales bacterium]|jgi:ankyrin repeat protein